MFKYNLNSIYIETTNTCNSRCIFCPHGLGSLKRPKQIMPNDLFFNIIDICKREGIHNIGFGGLGEFLLDPDFLVKARYVVSCGLILKSITTNGMLLTGDITAQLLNIGVKSLTISIDTLDKGDYESIRKGLCYTTVMKNIWDLLLLSEQHRSDTAINFNIVTPIDSSRIKNQFLDKFGLFRIRSSQCPSYQCTTGTT